MSRSVAGVSVSVRRSSGPGEIGRVFPLWRRVVPVVAVFAAIVGVLGLDSALSETGAAAKARVRILSRIDTEDPVVFITIDDGFRTPWITDWVLDQLQWPITNFLVSGPVRSKYRWFNQLTPHVTWGTHTRSHEQLPGRSLEEQKQAICGGADDLEQVSGRRPVWFRPPGGAYDSTTVDAVGACGMHALVTWRVRVNGSRIDTWGGPIRRGDIILLHYRADLALSLVSLRTELDRLGLRPAPLDEYLPYR